VPFVVELEGFVVDVVEPALVDGVFVMVVVVTLALGIGPPTATSLPSGVAHAEATNVNTATTGRMARNRNTGDKG
jgi:hypothetical protein